MGNLHNLTIDQTVAQADRASPGRRENRQGPFAVFYLFDVGRAANLLCSIFPLLPEGRLMKRFIYLVAVGVIFASAIGCAHKKAKRYTSANYADCCSPCCSCDGAAGPINGVVVPGPGVYPQAVGAVTGPIGRNVTPLTLDVTSTAALNSPSVRR